MSKQKKSKQNRSTFAESPKVLIGLGGSGKLAVMQHRKLHQDHYEAGLVRSIVIDTDSKFKEELGKDFYHMDRCEPHNLIPEIQERPEDFPGYEHLGPLPKVKKAAGSTQRLSRGCQRARTLGLLALLTELWLNVTMFLAFIAKPISELKPASMRLNAERERISRQTQVEGVIPQAVGDIPLEIHIVGSDGGGDASGKLILMGWLVNYVCRNRVGITNFEVYLHLIQPDVFRHDDREHLNANHLALVQELMEFYQDGETLDPLQLGPITLDRKQPPFANIYLWGRTTTLDNIYNNIDEVMQVAVECFRMQTEGAIGVEHRGQRVNHLNTDYPNITAAAGCARVTLEIEAMKLIGGILLALKIIDEHLLLHPSPETANSQGQEQADDFSHHVSLLNQARIFVRDLTGKLIVVPELTEIFGQTAREQIVDRLKDFARKFFEKSDITLEELRRNEVKRIAIPLGKRVMELMNTPGSVLQARGFLAALKPILDQLQQMRRVQIKGTNRELADLKEVEAKRRKSWYRRLSLTPRKTYLNHRQPELDAKLRLQKLTAQQSLTGDIQKIADFHWKTIEEWRAAFEHMVQQLELKLATFSQDREAQRPVCVRNVLDTEEETAEITKILTDNWVSAIQGFDFAWDDQDLVLRLAQDGPESATTVYAEELWEEVGMRKLLAYTTSFFSNLEALSIEAILADREYETAKEMLDNMREWAAPLVKINGNLQKPPAKELVLFASEKGATSYFAPAAAEYNWTTVESGDPHNVELLVQLNGINPLALVGVREEQQRDYEKLLEKETLHVFASWHQRIGAEHVGPLQLLLPNLDDTGVEANGKGNLRRGSHKEVPDVSA